MNGVYFQTNAMTYKLSIPLRRMKGKLTENYGIVLQNGIGVTAAQN